MFSSDRSDLYSSAAPPASFNAADILITKLIAEKKSPAENPNAGPDITLEKRKTEDGHWSSSTLKVETKVAELQDAGWRARARAMRCA